MCKNATQALTATDKLSAKNGNKKCRIVFDQHGGVDGENDMGITKDNAIAMLIKLVEAGFTDITISDLSCRGGTAKNFLDTAQDVADENKVNIKVRHAPEDRTSINGLKENNGELRFTLATIGKDGEAKSREYKNFVPENNVKNPGCNKILAKSKFLRE